MSFSSGRYCPRLTNTAAESSSARWVQGYLTLGCTRLHKTHIRWHFSYHLTHHGKNLGKARTAGRATHVHHSPFGIALPKRSMHSSSLSNRALDFHVHPAIRGFPYTLEQTRNRCPFLTLCSWDLMPTGGHPSGSRLWVAAAPQRGAVFVEHASTQSRPACRAAFATWTLARNEDSRLQPHLHAHLGGTPPEWRCKWLAAYGDDR